MEHSKEIYSIRPSQKGEERKSPSELRAHVGGPEPGLGLNTSQETRLTKLPWSRGVPPTPGPSLSQLRVSPAGAQISRQMREVCFWETSLPSSWHTLADFSFSQHKTPGEMPVWRKPSNRNHPITTRRVTDISLQHHPCQDSQKEAM